MKMNRAQKETFLVLFSLYKTIRMKAGVSVSRQECCMWSPENAWERQKRQEKRGMREPAAAAPYSALTCTGIKCMLAECKQIYCFNIPLLSRLKCNIFKWNEEWRRQSIFLSDV